MIKSPKAIILAAGESSRFWPLNAKHKSLTRVMGQSLIEHTIKSLRERGINNIAVIQGPDREIEKNLGDEQDVKFFIQPVASGMGDAIALVQDAESALVFNAHRVEAGSDAQGLIEKAQSSGAGLILQGEETDQPQLYGIMELEGDRVKSVVEKPIKETAPSNMRVAGSYLLPPDFSEYYKKTSGGHYSFEEALNLYAKENDVRFTINKRANFSLKYPWHLFATTKHLLDSQIKRQEIHPTAQIFQNAVIEGNVYIGENVKIFEGAVIKGPCYIGKNCVIGNHAVVRDYTNLEEGAGVGVFAEVARSIFQKNARVHSGYFGDSILGENCRAGAGTVTANVRLDRGEIIGTGLISLGAIVGSNTHIGINVSLMPGVLIGSNCLIGPAETVFKNLPDNTTFFSKKTL